MNMTEMEEQLLNNKIDAELEKFNWGALGLGILWAPFNGAGISYFVTFGAMLFCILAAFILPIIRFFFIFLAPAIILGFSIYMGKKGNEWSWQGKKWQSLEYFSEIQKKWAAFFTLYFIIMVILGIIGIASLFVIGGSFITQMKSDGGPEKLVNSIIVKQVLTKDPSCINARSGEEVAKIVVKQDPTATLYNKNSVLEKTKSGKTEFIMTFYKVGTNCTLEKKNCYVMLSDIVNGEASPKLKTYYDNKGKTLDVLMKLRDK